MNGLNVNFVIEEAEYFDRDYLSEYSAFYSVSAKQRKNTCKRLHFFSLSLGRSIIELLLQGNETAIAKLQKYYLGFTTLKPLEFTPIGKMVLKWYPESGNPEVRVTTPSRDYTIHLVNAKLKVHGIAWQQQDMGVSRCATVAIWTMMQSSAFLEYYAVPTTTEVTIAAHRTASLGDRVFPSDGLTKFQIKEAIKELNLTPHSIEGTVKHTIGSGFSRQVFGAHVAPLIRSGYPLLFIGQLGDSLHATCAVGFKEAGPAPIAAGDMFIEDSNIEFVYIHDDNIGPSAKFNIIEVPSSDPNSQCVALRRASSYAPPNASHVNYPDFVPYAIIAAVHKEMRFSLTDIISFMIRCVQGLSASDTIANINAVFGFSVSMKIMKCFDYIGGELERLLSGGPTKLSKIRNELFNLPDLMGLHVAVVRIGDGKNVLMDILIDCTDSPINTHVIAHTVYEPSFVHVIDVYNSAFVAPKPIAHGICPSLGIKIEAF
ncbi:hypothetical protein [Deinococcus rubellus]|uniref:Uncharacterized protein n=1 Tax=Deinococcus rubellus TaxID=1889240 RepID=A0ABY5YLE3_9DEIO|nr:hypothetical protein [Deinococcus rubellus]UWX65167.1 hypothetical protein N0D28_05785 [Deinococcus rubellus]